MKELEDLPWFPHQWRRWQMEFIGFFSKALQLYHPAYDTVSKDSKVIELCAGAAKHSEQWSKLIKLTLTDKYPIYPHIQCLDVLHDPFTDKGHYMMFNAFHHFNDQEQLFLVKKLIKSGQPFTISEIISPNLWSGMKVLLASTVGVLLISPFIKPFSWKRLLCTYIIPIIPITVTIDGLITVLKSKSLQGYKSLLSHFSAMHIYSARTKFFNPIIIITSRPN